MSFFSSETAKVLVDVNERFKDGKGRMQPSKWRNREAVYLLTVHLLSRNFRGRMQTTAARAGERGRERKREKGDFLEAEAANLCMFLVQARAARIDRSRASYDKASYDKREQFRLPVNHVSIAIVISEGRIMPRWRNLSASRNELPLRAKRGIFDDVFV